MRIKGTVRWFNDSQGCGFISPNDGSKDCFVRGSAVEGLRTLAEGEPVEFEVIRGANGPLALNVVRVARSDHDG